MSLPPIPEAWRTDWHLAGRIDELEGAGALEVTVAGIALRIVDEPSGLAAHGDGRRYPVMVVDDEIFVLLGDGPE